MEKRPSDGDNRDRNPVQDRRTRQRVEGLVVGQHIGIHSGPLGGHAKSGSRDTMAPSMRQAHDPRADVFGDFHDGIQLTNPRLHARRMSVAHTESLRVIGMNMKSAAGFALHQNLDVVHPRIVRTKVSSTDQHELARREFVDRRFETNDIGE